MVNINPPLPPIISNNATVKHEKDENKSCSRCSCFTSKKYPNKLSKIYGDHIGNDVCALYGKIISDANREDNTQVHKKFAQNCSEYYPGDQDNDFENFDKDRIYIGIPSLNLVRESNKEDRPASCALCYYNRSVASNMGDNIGVDTSLPSCAVFGFIVLPGEGRKIASTCKYGVNRGGTAAANSAVTVPLGSIKAFPEMEITYDLTVEWTDPLDYVSDHPVTEEDKALGIRAWCNVYEVKGDPNSRYISMPIFDPDSFTEEERVSIPRPGQDEHPELYVDHQGLDYAMLALWKMGFTPCLSGVSGVGKTEAYRYMAYRMQLPFERVSINNSTDIDHLVGKNGYSKETGTYFDMGVIPKAWSRRCVIVVDEPNVGPPDVWQFFRPLTDNSKQLVLPSDKGQHIEKNEHCYFGMAMNPVWDVRNVGTHEIGDADARRLMHIYVPPPDAETEKKIIMERCMANGYKMGNGVYASIERISKAIRAQCNDDTLPFQWGTAMVIKVALASQYFDLTRCFRLAIADFTDPDSAEIVLSIVKSHL